MCDRYLEDTELVCNCQALYLRAWTGQNSVTLHDATCTNLDNRPLNDIKEEEFGLCTEGTSLLKALAAGLNPQVPESG